MGAVVWPGRQETKAVKTTHRPGHLAGMAIGGQRLAGTHQKFQGTSGLMTPRISR